MSETELTQEEKTILAMVRKRDSLENEITQLKSDLAEQCRLNGIGQERELKLAADLAEAVKCIESYQKESAVEIVNKWKRFWMNQTQNSQADFENYSSRAIGVDANMKYHLADLISEKAREFLGKVKK